MIETYGRSSVNLNGRSESIGCPVDASSLLNVKLTGKDNHFSGAET
jgi:hypothetical protein